MPELLDQPLSRRGLVASTGTAVLASVVPREAATARGRLRLRVGVLTTAGSGHPAGGPRLLDGLASGFASSAVGVDARLLSRPVPQGCAGAAAGARELVAAGAQVIVAAVSSHAVGQVVPVCAEARAGLVVANVGAHLVTARPTGHPVLQNSLQHWQCALSAGSWAARHLGRSLFMIVSVPDAGYDTVFAVRRGFQANGGEVVGRALTHESPTAPGLAAAARAARASGAAVVSVSASGPRAAQIVRACRAAGVRAELVVDSLALEQFNIGSFGRQAVGLHSTASWTRSADTAANRAFVRGYRARTGSRPDAFSALGHDTALLVAEGVRRVLAAGRPWSALPRTLAGATVAGVRGPQAVHDELGTVSTPLAVRRVVAASRGPEPVVVARRSRVPGTPPALAALERGEVAAYFNEYLTT